MKYSEIKENKTAECKLVETLPVANILGEGVTWHPEQQSAWWTDIHGKQLFCYHLESGEVKRFDVPHRIGCFGFVEGNEQLIVASELGFAYFDLQTKTFQWLVEPELHRPGNRFNDGKVDPSGRFWAGGMVEKPQIKDQVAGLYRLDANLTFEKALDGFAITNGLCWSPDGKIMYHADSPSKTILQYDFDIASGCPANPRVFAKTESHCVPDGATVDCEGGVWVALWGAGEVVRFAPDGSISHRISVPAHQPTCVCFGGPDLDRLFVTSARLHLRAPDEDDGNVFVYQTPFTGIAPTFFQAK